MLAIAAYFQSSGAKSAYNTEGPRDAARRDHDRASSACRVAVVGAALFLRYSLAQFLRFWLARLIYEQQAADRPHRRVPLELSRVARRAARGVRGTATSLSTRTSDGQAEHPLADDVALDLLGAAADAGCSTG